MGQDDLELDAHRAQQAGVVACKLAQLIPIANQRKIGERRVALHRAADGA